MLLLKDGNIHFFWKVHQLPHREHRLFSHFPCQVLQIILHFWVIGSVLVLRRPKCLWPCKSDCKLFQEYFSNLKWKFNLYRTWWDILRVDFFLYWWDFYRIKIQVENTLQRKISSAFYFEGKVVFINWYSWKILTLL